MALKVTRPPESRKQWHLVPQLPRQHSCSSQRGKSYPRTMINSSAVSCSLPPFPPQVSLLWRAARPPVTPQRTHGLRPNGWFRKGADQCCSAHKGLLKGSATGKHTSESKRTRSPREDDVARWEHNSGSEVLEMKKAKFRVPVSSYSILFPKCIMGISQQRYHCLYMNRRCTFGQKCWKVLLSGLWIRTLVFTLLSGMPGLCRWCSGLSQYLTHNHF